MAQSVIEEMRGQHPVYVFTYRNKRINRMLNSGWKDARKKAGLDVRVHDLKHTFGRRLRAAGVSFEDRQDLLGHKSQRITTHYSAAELANLTAAANKACVERDSSILASVPAKGLHINGLTPMGLDNPKLVAQKTQLVEALISGLTANSEGGRAKVAQGV